MKLPFAVPVLFAALAALAAVPLPTAAPTVPAVPADHTYQIDGVHTSVLFKVKHANASWFYGTFDKVSGAFTLDPSAPANSKVTVTIAADSVDTRDDKRDQHVRNADFFDAKQYPDITFTSTKVETKPDEGGQMDFLVTGELELRGIKRPLQATLVKTGEGEFHGKRIGYETMFTIKRSDFGMDYGIAANVLGDEVTLKVSVEGVQAGK